MDRGVVLDPYGKKFMKFISKQRKINVCVKKVAAISKSIECSRVLPGTFLLCDARIYARRKLRLVNLLWRNHICTLISVAINVTYRSPVTYKSPVTAGQSPPCDQNWLEPTDVLDAPRIQISLPVQRWSAALYVNDIREALLLCSPQDNSSSLEVPCTEILISTVKGTYQEGGGGMPDKLMPS